MYKLYEQYNYTLAVINFSLNPLDIMLNPLSFHFLVFKMIDTRDPLVSYGGEDYMREVSCPTQVVYTH